MAEQATTVTNDQPSGPVPDALTTREGDEALAAFFGPDDQDPDENENGNTPDAGNPDDPAVGDPEQDVDPEDPEQPVDAEDPEVDPEESEATPDNAGRFVADTAKVNFNGKTISVAELKEFADNRSKEFQRDYTAKTMELSERAKAYEAREAEFSQSQERVAKEREFIRYYAENYIPQAPVRPDRPAEVDPVAWSVYTEQKEKYDEMVDAWKQAKTMSDETNKVEQEKAQQAKQQQLRTEHEKLVSRFPVLKDKAKHEAFWNSLSTDAEKFFGVPKDSVKALDNADMVYILHKAVKQMRIEAGSATVKKEVTGKPPLVNGSGRRQSPGAAQQRSHAANVQRLRETGSNAAGEAAILKFLGE